jgi:hypothetical protein
VYRGLWHKILQKKPESLIRAKIGYYTIEKIDEKSVKIGCHIISRKEIDRLARRFEWQERKGVQEEIK